MNKIDDLEKIKIEILRDALKDASDTIRALDKKTIFLVSYNALFLSAIGALLIRKSEIISNLSPLTALLALILFSWVLLIIYIMINISPNINPLDIIFDREKPFGKNLFFIKTDSDKISIEHLTNSYDQEITDIKKVKKLLYSEILKLSYIRDKRIKHINYASIGSYTFTFIFALSILFIFFDK